ncbi:MAG: hypothetical protein ABI547_07365, partial [Betaproteobacteria bacterium]
MIRAHKVILAGLFAATVAAVASLYVAPYPVTDFAAVRDAWRGSDAWLLDRRGELLPRIRLDYARRRGEWTPLNEVSSVFA